MAIDRGGQLPKNVRLLAGIGLETLKGCNGGLGGGSVVDA